MPATDSPAVSVSGGGQASTRSAPPRGRRTSRVAGALAATCALVTGALVGAPAANAAVDCSAPAGPAVDWSGCDKSGITIDGSNTPNPIDMSGGTFVGTNFTGANLNVINLDGSNMANANFTNVGLNDSTLRNTTLTGAHFTNTSGDVGTSVTNSIFDNSTLSGAKFNAASLQFSSFRGTTLTGADLTNVKASLQNDFTSANLTNAILTGSRLGGSPRFPSILDGITSAGNIGGPSSLPFGWKWQASKSRLKQVIPMNWLSEMGNINYGQKTKVLTVPTHAKKIKKVRGWCSKATDQGGKFKPAKDCKAIPKYRKGGKKLKVFTKPKPGKAGKCRPAANVNLVVKAKKQLPGGSATKVYASWGVDRGSNCN